MGQVLRMRRSGEGTSGRGEPASSLDRALADAIAKSCAEVTHNLNGQRLGPKGRVTRERILTAALELIESEEEPLTLAAVARRASLGMTSLYNYFTDLTELLLAMLEPVMATSERAFLGALRERWTDDVLYERCHAFVADYNHFWSRHARLLHMRNAAADQQDERMMRQRILSTRPIIELLVRQMDENAPDGGPVTSMATMVMIAIERSITLATDRELRRLVGMGPEVSEDRFIEPGARLMEFAIRDARAQEVPVYPGALFG